jgi:TatD DNase family protein
MMLIDTHAHLNFNAFKGDFEEVIKKCTDEKVGVINVGSEYKTSKRAVEMAEKFEGLWAVVGLHPGHLSEHEIDDGEGNWIKSAVEKFDREKYLELAKSEKVVAIGEIGLDYSNGEGNKCDQAETFKEQIKLAVDLDLPIAVHCRNAYKDLLEVITEEKKKYGEKMRGVIHSYLGRLNYAKIFNEMGFSLGFNGIITYARDYDKVIKNIDLEYILTETDCPWLTPVPYRGKRNEPAYVRYVAEKIAEVREISFDETVQITSENAKRLFRI